MRVPEPAPAPVPDALRIPMWGYEIAARATVSAALNVTNPHVGL